LKTSIKRSREADSPMFVDQTNMLWQARCEDRESLSSGCRSLSVNVLGIT
jgi:hypothetical protein